MYSYENDTPISHTIDILKRVPQELIYEYILGYKPVINQYVRSPLRLDDTRAGAWFEYGSNGLLLFIDFADERIARDCFQMLMDLQNLTLQEAIKEISTEFEVIKLPIIYPEFQIIKRKVGGHRIQRLKSEDRIETDISFKARAFLDKDKRFWYDRYGITRANLIEDGVFPLIWYKFYSARKKEWLIIRPLDVSYAYTKFLKPNKIKIYVPFCKTTRGKFITNCNEDDIGGYYLLPQSGRQLIIAKSYKDWRVLTNQGVIAIWLQNEGMLPSPEILLDLCARFQKIIILFDNDEPGIRAANKVSSFLNSLSPDSQKSRIVIIPDLSTKDPSDLRHLKGEQALIQFLNLNSIYGKHSTGDTSFMDTPFDTSI